MRRHIALKHRACRPFVCSTCDMEFTSRVYIYIYMCMCVCVCMCMGGCVYICMCSSIYVCMCIYLYICELKINNNTVNNINVIYVGPI